MTEHNGHTDPLLTNKVPSFEEFMKTEPKRAMEQHEQECGCDDEECMEGYGHNWTRQMWWDEGYLVYFPEGEEMHGKPKDIE